MSIIPDTKRVIVIVGPTSSGKTSLALNLCKEFDGSIVSADSRQIYKYMDVGTGKLPIDSDLTVKQGNGKWVLDGIDVWGYDIVEPGRYYSVFDYAQFALGKLKELGSLKKTVFLVGGSGFYVDAVTGKMPIKSGEPDFNLRSELEKMTTPELQKKLTSLNVEVFNKIDKENSVRLIRAIEKEMTGSGEDTPLPYLKDTEFIYLGMKTDRSILFNSADIWLDKVWRGGLIEEVENLIKMGFANTPQLQGLVYKTVLAYMEGKLTEDDAVQRAKYDLHSYIRRQLTWFKKNREIVWFDISEKNFSQKVCNHVKSK
jgi:tRNA dimethylallyltransferase